PATILNVVVFPHPDGPRKATSSPSWSSRRILSTAVTLPKRLETSSIRMRATRSRSVTAYLAVPTGNHVLARPRVEPDPVPLVDLVDLVGGHGNQLLQFGRQHDLGVRWRDVVALCPLGLRLGGEHVVDELEGEVLDLAAGGHVHVLLEHEQALFAYDELDRQALQLEARGGG